jgi:hypothetical protein
MNAFYRLGAGLCLICYRHTTSVRTVPLTPSTAFHKRTSSITSPACWVGVFTAAERVALRSTIAHFGRRHSPYRRGDITQHAR